MNICLKVKRLSAGLIIALCAGISAHSQTLTTEMPLITRFGADATYMPFEGINRQGEFEGFDIDLGYAICAEIKAQCSFVHQNWDGITQGLYANKYDAILSSMSITAERSESVDFTQTIWDVPHALLSRKSAPLLATNESLKGKRIGVQEDTIQDMYAGRYWSNAKIKSYKTIEESYDDIRKGKLHGIFADRVVLDYGILHQPKARGLIVSDTVLSKEAPMILGKGVGIAVRKGDRELRDALNRGFDAVRKSGAYRVIQAKYFNYDIYNR